jgi:hypothetical protein
VTAVSRMALPAVGRDAGWAGDFRALARSQSRLPITGRYTGAAFGKGLGLSVRYWIQTSDFHRVRTRSTPREHDRNT